ncbi:MAG: hypothetical protein OXD54_06025 [Candidatus Poribacteria bacterium]|nr:hypothetical protein [Candidatus Poribacteria bacterium]
MKLTRYMNLCKYIDLLSSKTLFLPRYDNLGDSYEGCLGHIPTDIFIKKQTDYISRISTRPLKPLTIAKEFLEVFEPLLYHEFLREFTFVSCWHQSEIESIPMWKMYADKGIMIKSDLCSLKSSLGISAESYQHSIVFQENHDIDPCNGYDIFFETEKVKYVTRGSYIEPVGSARYFHKQLEYSSERELRVIMQLHLSPEQRFNLPHVFDNMDISSFHTTKIKDVIHQVWNDIKITYKKHASLLDVGFSGCGVRCPVNIQSLIKEVVVSPESSDSEIKEIESLNQKFGLGVDVKKSEIQIAPSVTKFSARLSDEVIIELEF